jgi:hypothetical protein
MILNILFLALLLTLEPFVFSSGVFQSVYVLRLVIFVMLLTLFLTRLTATLDYHACSTRGTQKAAFLVAITLSILDLSLTVVRSFSVYSIFEFLINHAILLFILLFFLTFFQTKNFIKLNVFLISVPFLVFVLATFFPQLFFEKSIPTRPVSSVIMYGEVFFLSFVAFDNDLLVGRRFAGWFLEPGLLAAYAFIMMCMLETRFKSFKNINNFVLLGASIFTKSLILLLTIKFFRINYFTLLTTLLVTIFLSLIMPDGLMNKFFLYIKSKIAGRFDFFGRASEIQDSVSLLSAANIWMLPIVLVSYLIILKCIWASSESVIRLIFLASLFFTIIRIDFLNWYTIYLLSSSILLFESREKVQWKGA